MRLLTFIQAMVPGSSVANTCTVASHSNPSQALCPGSSVARSGFAGWPLPVFLVLLLALAGCPFDQQADTLENRIRSLPAVSELVAVHPDAEVTTAYWNADTVRAVIEQIKEECAQEIPIEPYYRVHVLGKNVDAVLYFNAETEELTCRADRRVKPELPKPVYETPETPPAQEEKPTPYLEVFEAGGDPVYDKPVQFTKLVEAECDPKRPCVPKQVFEGRTDLLGKIEPVDPMKLDGSTIVVQGYHPVPPEKIITLKYGYRVIVEPIVLASTYLPLKIKVVDIARKDAIPNRVATVGVGDAATGINKIINEKGELSLNEADFKLLGAQYMDSRGVPAFGKITVKVDGYEEAGVILALEEPFRAQSIENVYTAFEPVPTNVGWDLRTKEVTLRLNAKIPIPSDQTFFEFAFLEGENYFSIPVKVKEGWLAELFLVDIERQGLACDKIAKYENEQFVEHARESLARNFVMESGRGYRLTCSKGGAYKIRGPHIYEPITLPLRPGFTFVGVTAGMENRFPRDLISGCNVKSITEYDEAGVRGLIDKFERATPGKAYMVFCELAGEWNKY